MSRRPQLLQLSKIVPFQGGLDLVSPAMLVKDGFCTNGQNYEVEARGYRRIAGFERYDGRPKPSAAEYYILNFDAGSAAIVEGDTVTGATSGDSGIAVADATLSSGTYAGGDAAGFVVLYNIAGSTTYFADDEALQVGGVTRATANGTALLNGANNDTDHYTYIDSVTSKRRNAIQKPSGSGAIRGVATYNGDVYCWRDNSGGTAGQMFKATASGWVVQTFGRYIKFDGGKKKFAEGETLTGATSAATATIERLIHNDGAWDPTTGDASGYFVLSGVSGTFQDNETITSATGEAVANGADVAITLPAGGKYRAIEHNFFATETTVRLYFTNGNGPAMEWDGTVLAPVFTGLSTALEKPTHIAALAQHLFLGYLGGLLQYSSPGLPLVFDAAQGAGEIGFGYTPTGLKEYRGSLVITARNKIGYLSGTSSSNFVLEMISDDSGGVTDTLEIVGSPLFMDDAGIRDLQTAQSYGNWRVGTKTQLIEPLLQSKRDGNITPVAALRVRAKSQYRVFFSDGTGIVLYLGRRDPEILPINLGKTFNCVTSGEDSSGNEVLLAGDNDGWVYELDRGTSFDGSSIEAYIRLAFSHLGSPSVEKRFHRARFEGQAGARNNALKVAASFGYGTPDQPATGEQALTIYGAGGFWNEDNWNEFNWSAQTEGQSIIEIAGIGENISLVIMSDSAVENPHTLSTMTIYYSPRRQIR